MNAHHKSAAKPSTVQHSTAHNRSNSAQQGTAGLSRTQQGRAQQDTAGQGRARQGRAQHGTAGQGTAQQGRAQQGPAWHSRAQHGTAGQGMAQHCRAEQGRAGQGRAGPVGRWTRAEPLVNEFPAALHILAPRQHPCHQHLFCTSCDHQPLSCI